MADSLSNPFKGLRPYLEEDREKLFGRDRDLILMKDRIFSSRTTLLFAGSGVGKTSFLNAKVIPELKYQCSVIWHNRWTGAQEIDETFEDEGFRLWPPSAMVTDLKSLIRRKRERAVTTSINNDNTESATVSESALSADCHRTISQSLSASGGDRKLSQSLECFKRSFQQESEAAGKPVPSESQRCILILDQFEEVFQYHSFEDYFNAFVKDLCEIINNDDYQIRLVLSMRQEFLGELSVFDNRIPDLFNNYYRLKYPDKEEAEEIIRRTCELVDIGADSNGLSLLVDDLSRIEKTGSSFSERGRPAAKSSRVLKRSFVALPYLQIACDRLWNEQFGPTPVPSNGTSDSPALAVGGAVSSTQFLSTYRTDDSTGSANGTVCDAQRVVSTFCQEKLSAPFLNSREQDIAANAFGFLVTKQGAKMAYELTSLAEHMEEKIGPLKTTLEKLSRSDVHILRESRGPERSYWFELYHDMYAGIVDKWKRRFEKRKRKRNRKILAIELGVPAAFLIIAYILVHWVGYPYQYQTAIQTYRDGMKSADVISDESYGPAILAFTKLRDTLGYGRRAESLWAEVWERRAHLYELQERRDEAIISLLQAAALTHDSTSSDRYLRQASSLQSDDYPGLLNTYCLDCKGASVSRDGKYVLTIGRGSEVKLWETATGTLVRTLCDDCSQAIFSNDGNVVITVRSTSTPAKQGSSEAAPEGTAQSARQSQSNVNGNERSAGSSSARSGSNANSTSNSSNARKEPGWEVRLIPINWAYEPMTPATFFVKSSEAPTESGTATRDAEAESARTDAQSTTQSATSASASATASTATSTANQFAIKSAALSPKIGLLISGILQGQVMIWRTDGSVLGNSIPIVDAANTRKPNMSLVRLSFSSDGAYLIVGLINNAAKIYSLTDQGAVPATKINGGIAGRRNAFSPDGKLLLTSSREANVQLWNLDSQIVVKDIPGTLEKDIAKLAFSSDGKTFLVGMRTGASHVWDAETLTERYQPLEFKALNSRAEIGPQGKSLVRVATSGVGRNRFEKWSFESGQKIGDLALNTLFTSLSFSPDIQSFVVRSGMAVRRWSIPPPKPKVNILGPPEGSTFLFLSSDGKSALLSKATYSPEIWNVDNNTAVSFEFKNEEFADDYVFSPDGKHLAVSDGSNDLKYWDVSRPDTPSRLHFDNGMSLFMFSPDGKYFVVVTESKEFSVFDANSRELIARKVNSSEIGVLAFSPDAKYMVTAPYDMSYAEGTELTPAESKSDLGLHVWTLPEGNAVELSEKISPRSKTANLSKKERLFTCCNDSSDGQLWDLMTGKRTFTLSQVVVGATLAASAFNPDGNLLVTGGSDGAVRLWDVQNGKPIGEQIKLGSAANELRFSEDGRYVVIATKSWLHRVAVDPTGLRYMSGLLVRDAISETFRLLGPDAWQVRYFQYLDGAPQVITARFGFGIESPPLTNLGDTTAAKPDPSKLLEEWQSRLALRVDRLGQITRTLPDAVQSEDDDAEKAAGTAGQ